MIHKQFDLDPADPGSFFQTLHDWFIEQLIPFHLQGQSRSIPYHFDNIDGFPQDPLDLYPCPEDQPANPSLLNIRILVHEVSPFVIDFTYNPYNLYITNIGRTRSVNPQALPAFSVTPIRNFAYSSLDPFDITPWSFAGILDHVGETAARDPSRQFDQFIFLFAEIPRFGLMYFLQMLATGHSISVSPELVELFRNWASLSKYCRDWSHNFPPGPPPPGPTGGGTGGGTGAVNATPWWSRRGQPTDNNENNKNSKNSKNNNKTKSRALLNNVISSLNTMIDNITETRDTLSKKMLDCKIAKTVGTGVSIVGSVLLFSPLFFVGVGIIAAGAATTLGTTIADGIISLNEKDRFFDACKASDVAITEFWGGIVSTPKEHRLLMFAMRSLHISHFSSILDRLGLSVQGPAATAAAVATMLPSTSSTASSTAAAISASASVAKPVADLGRASISSVSTVASLSEISLSAGETGVAIGESALAAGESASAVSEIGIGTAETALAAGRVGLSIGANAGAVMAGAGIVFSAAAIALTWTLDDHNIAMMNDTLTKAQDLCAHYQQLFTEFDKLDQT